MIATFSSTNATYNFSFVDCSVISGRHFFIRRGGRQEHLKKNHLGHQAAFYYLSYRCVWNCQMGAPCSCRGLCSLRRCRGQILSEKGEGGRGGVSQMERARGGTGDPLYSSHTSTFFQITHIHNIIITGL